MAKRIKCPNKECKAESGFDVFDISDIKAGEVILICKSCGQEFKANVTPEQIENEPNFEKSEGGDKK